MKCLKSHGWGSISNYMDFEFEKVKNTIINADFMDVTKHYPDNFFDLGVFDYPYGIDYTGQRERKVKYDGANGWRKTEFKPWDNVRFTEEQVLETLRITKNQIIWGGNYYIDYLKPTQGWLVWNKVQRGFSLADGELAWTSFDKAMRIFDFARACQMHTEAREHPTQKPVKLIEWCIDYARLNPGAKIIDVCSGSGTTAIASYNKGFDFLCIEKDEDYCPQSIERLEYHIKYGSPKKKPLAEQKMLF